MHIYILMNSNIQQFYILIFIYKHQNMKCLKRYFKYMQIVPYNIMQTWFKFFRNFNVFSIIIYNAGCKK